MLTDREIISEYKRISGNAKQKYEIVCDLCGCGSNKESKTHVKQVLQEQNLFKYTAKGIDLALEAKNIQKMLDDGMTKSAIADKYGTAGGVLNTIIKEFNLKTAKTVKNKPENEKKSPKTEKTVKRVAITGSKDLKIDDCKANTQRYLDNMNNQPAPKDNECGIPFVDVPDISNQTRKAFEKLGDTIKKMTNDSEKALEKLGDSFKEIGIPGILAIAEDKPADDIDIFKLLEDTQGELATMSYCVCSAIEHLLMNDRRNGHEDIVQAYKCLAKYNELAENVLHNH